MKIHSSESKYVGDSRRSVVVGKIMLCLLFVIIERFVEGTWQIRRKVFKWKRRRNG